MTDFNFDEYIRGILEDLTRGKSEIERLVKAAGLWEGSSAPVHKAVLEKACTSLQVLADRLLVNQTERQIAFDDAIEKLVKAQEDARQGEKASENERAKLQQARDEMLDIKSSFEKAQLGFQRVLGETRESLERQRLEAREAAGSNEQKLDDVKRERDDARREVDHQFKMSRTVDQVVNAFAVTERNLQAEVAQLQSKLEEVRRSTETTREKRETEYQIQLRDQQARFDSEKDKLVQALAADKQSYQNDILNMFTTALGAEVENLKRGVAGLNESIVENHTEMKNHASERRAYDEDAWACSRATTIKGIKSFEDAGSRILRDLDISVKRMMQNVKIVIDTELVAQRSKLCEVVGQAGQLGLKLKSAAEAQCEMELQLTGMKQSIADFLADHRKSLDEDSLAQMKAQKELIDAAEAAVNKNERAVVLLGEDSEQREGRLAKIENVASSLEQLEAANRQAKVSLENERDKIRQREAELGEEKTAMKAILSREEKRLNGRRAEIEEFDKAHKKEMSKITQSLLETLPTNMVADMADVKAAVQETAMGMADVKAAITKLPIREEHRYELARHFEKMSLSLKDPEDGKDLLLEIVRKLDEQKDTLATRSDLPDVGNILSDTLPTMQHFDTLLDSVNALPTYDHFERIESSMGVLVTNAEFEQIHEGMKTLPTKKDVDAVLRYIRKLSIGDRFERIEGQVKSTMKTQSGEELLNALCVKLEQQGQSLRNLASSELQHLKHEMISTNSAEAGKVQSAITDGLSNTQNSILKRFETFNKAMKRVRAENESPETIALMPQASRQRVETAVSPTPASRRDRLGAVPPCSLTQISRAASTSDEERQVLTQARSQVQIPETAPKSYPELPETVQRVYDKIRFPAGWDHKSDKGVAFRNTFARLPKKLESKRKYDLESEIDRYASGDKSKWPMNPRPCFFSLILGYKSQPADTATEPFTRRAQCPTCSSKKLEYPCVYLGYADGVPDPIGPRDPQSGKHLGKPLTYAQREPLTAADGKRWTLGERVDV